MVISGTNDYRGIVDKQGNFTGWYFSRNSGRTVENEGLLPGVTDSTGTELPSGGDPTVAFDSGCRHAYGASINFDAAAPGQGHSVEAVYASTPATLASCPQGGSGGTLTHPECWPTRRTVAEPPLDTSSTRTGWPPPAATSGSPSTTSRPSTPSENEEASTVEIVRCTSDLVT